MSVVWDRRNPGFAAGGVISGGVPGDDSVPACLSPGGYMAGHVSPLPDAEDDVPDDDGGYVCSRCQRKQHDRCAEPLCNCCAGGES